MKSASEMILATWLSQISASNLSLNLPVDRRIHCRTIGRTPDLNRLDFGNDEPI
jgi:hypothetical protein